MPSGGKNAAVQLEEKNPVLQLNDIRKDCIYELKYENEEMPEKRFCFKLTIDGKTFEGSGPTKKAAKAAAATKALKHPAVNANANKFRAQQAQKHKNFQQNKQQNKQVNYGQNKQPNYGQNKLQNFGQNKQMMYGQGLGGFVQNKQRAFVNKQAQGIVSNGVQYINGRQVCQFYLDSLCVRGKDCPNYHPEYSSRPDAVRRPQVPQADTYTWLQFCQNYIYLRCPRPDCKFLHVSKDDEDIYRRSGKIPAHVVEQAVRKAMADEVAPPGVTQACKAYLEGQCNWYSCPFRHLSRQEFSHEVLDLLHKQFDKKIRPNEDYRLISNRLLDRDPYGFDSRRLLEDKRLPDRRLIEEHRLPDSRVLEDSRRDGPSRLADRRDYDRHGPPPGDQDWLVNGMQNLMRDHDANKRQKELNDLRDELRILHEENKKLRDSVRARSMEEDKFSRYGHPQERSDPRNETIFKDTISLLKDENQEIRRLLLSGDRERLYQADHLYGKPLYGDSYFPDMRSELRRQNPELYDFDELLSSGMNRREKEVQQHSLMGMPLTSAKYPPPQMMGQQKLKKKPNNQVFKIPTKKSGQMLQSATRPSYQVKFGNAKKVYLPQHKKAKQQQQQHQQQQQLQQQQKKSNPQQKQKNLVQQQQQKNAKQTDKAKPIVTVSGNKQDGQSKERREKRPKRPALLRRSDDDVVIEGETTPGSEELNENVAETPESNNVTDRSASEGSEEHQENGIASPENISHGDDKELKQGEGDLENDVVSPENKNNKGGDKKKKECCDASPQNKNNGGDEEEKREGDQENCVVSPESKNNKGGDKEKKEGEGDQECDVSPQNKNNGGGDEKKHGDQENSVVSSESKNNEGGDKKAFEGGSDRWVDATEDGF